MQSIQDHTAVLDGVSPIMSFVTQNVSTLTHAPVAPALTAEALASSIEGRDVLKPGMPGYQVQQQYNAVADLEFEAQRLGPRPALTAAVPSLSDPASPFGGKSIGQLLRDSGMAPVHVQSESARLRHMSAVLPSLRQGLMAASGASRKAAYEGALIAARAVVAELEGWGPAVLESAEQEPAVRQYDAMKRGIAQRITQGKRALALLSADTITAYQVSVTSANQAKELEQLRKLVNKK